MIPENNFLSSEFSKLLLFLHLSVLVVFFIKWTRKPGFYQFIIDGICARKRVLSDDCNDLTTLIFFPRYHHSLVYL
jgi:hypothetical protein